MSTPGPRTDGDPDGSRTPGRALRAAAVRMLSWLPARSGMRLRRAVAALRGRDEIPWERRPPAMTIPQHGPDAGAGPATLEPAPVLLLALGLDAGAVADLVAAVQRRAARDGLRALTVIDCDTFTPLRRAGLVFEYLPPREDFERHLGGDYDAFRAARLAELSAAYRPERVVLVRRPDDVDELPASLLAHWRVP